MKLVGVWLCVSLVCECVNVCVFLNMRLHMSVRTRTQTASAAPLRPACLFVLQNLSHFLPLWRTSSVPCGRAYALIVITLGLRIRCTRIHRDGGASRHVRSSISTRMLSLPHRFCFPFHMRRHARRTSMLHSHKTLLPNCSQTERGRT